MVAYHASGIISMVATSMLGNLEVPTLVYWIKFALFYIPKQAAFVVGGALTAPRFRVITATILAVVATGMSLLVHVLGQRTVGITNYTHVAAETVGAILGAIFIALVSRPAAPPATKTPSPFRLEQD
jgi:hypothetical protein